MTKKILLVAALLIGGISYGQNGNVGIGTTTPDSSARLEIKGVNKGMLAPKVALTSTTDTVTIPHPARGLWVYNTNTSVAGGVDSDHHYWWDGSKWIRAITTVRPTGTTSPATILWGDITTNPTLLTSNSTYVLGPYTVPSDGWYSCYIRSYFVSYFTAPAPTDAHITPISQVWYTICDNATPNPDAGQLFDSRFICSVEAVTPSTSPFIYLQSGKNYYVKFRAIPISSGTECYVGTERQVILKQFK